MNGVLKVGLDKAASTLSGGHNIQLGLCRVLGYKQRLSCRKHTEGHIASYRPKGRHKSKKTDILQTDKEEVPNLIEMAPQSAVLFAPLLII